ncbi:hypothetical protein FSP39_023793 [Pinctada imbricata]|uniref:DDE Tnp4 domain-containing protein n=1 Tax=Pinctada imbricata TaxID=66713 RepID=A0AA89BN23_PINIB|nr:hypothetical protein FSP39_023793 [Pinctada imbricata]
MMVLVLDGTYIYIQKSLHFQFQRRSYSLHKGRPLVKPMVIVTTSGYFVTVLGPYLSDGKNNDAKIIEHIMKCNTEDVKNWIDENDVFIVDRGFRDALPFLSSLGINAEMPAFMKKEYIRIVCAISNKYFQPLSNGNEDEDQVLAAKMAYLSRQVNWLQEYVEEKGFHRKTAQWREIDSNDDFPSLDEDQIRQLTCGTYQMKLCASYAQEHKDGNCDISVHKDEPTLLRCIIYSSVVYDTTIAILLENNMTSSRKLETESIQNQEKLGTKANKQKPPPHEKKRTPDVGVRPGTQEE